MVTDLPLRSRVCWELMASPDQVGQEGLCQQAGQTDKEGFKLDSVGEEEGVLSNRGC